MRDGNNNWLWMKKRYLKKETGGLLMTAQGQSSRARWVKRYIYKTTDKTAGCLEKLMKMLAI